MCLDQGPLGWQCSSRVSSSLPPPFRWHFDVSSTLAGLSQTPTIKPQPHSLSWTQAKRCSSLPSTSDPTAKPTLPQADQLTPKLSTNLQWGGASHPSHFPAMPLGKSCTGKGQRQDGISLHPLVLHPRLSSLLLLSFWCSSSYLWTAACLINDNILVFFHYCYIPRYLYYS